MEVHGGLNEPDRLSTSNWNRVIEIISKSQLLISLSCFGQLHHVISG